VLRVLPSCVLAVRGEWHGGEGEEELSLWRGEGSAGSPLALSNFREVFVPLRGLFRHDLIPAQMLGLVEVLVGLLD